MDNEIINRVASSGLVTFDLEEYYQKGERVLIDIKDQLFQGQVLRERDFREFISTYNWQQYEDKFISITCSSDAIIPIWAYMLIAAALQPYARVISYGSLEHLEEKLFESALAQVKWDFFKDRKVVIKGCSKVEVPVSIYIEVTQKLKPVVSSLMFGEPCSTVPLYKAPKH
jgi:hypothetical protein